VNGISAKQLAKIGWTVSSDSAGLFR